MHGREREKRVREGGQLNPSPTIPSHTIVYHSCLPQPDSARSLMIIPDPFSPSLSSSLLPPSPPPPPLDSSANKTFLFPLCHRRLFFCNLIISKQTRLLYSLTTNLISFSHLYHPPCQRCQRKKELFWLLGESANHMFFCFFTDRIEICSR